MPCGACSEEQLEYALNKFVYNQEHTSVYVNYLNCILGTITAFIH